MCGNKTQQTTQATTTDLPDYLKPYVERTLGRAEAESNKGYEAYTGPRIAANDPNTTAARNQLVGIAGTGIEGLNEAQDYTRQGLDALGGLGNYETGNFTASSYSDPTSFAGADRYAALGNYGPGNFTAANYSDPTKFTGSNVTDYMSPYMDAVLKSQKDNAILDYERATGTRDAKAVNAGAFGGSRRFVQEGMDQESLLRNLGDIDAAGRQEAFKVAMSQFNTDRAAMTDVEKARADEINRVQTGIEASRQFGAGQGLSALNAEASQFNTDRNALTDVEKSRAAENARVQTGTEASRQFGAGQGLAAIEAGQGLVGDLTKQGELERQTNIQNTQLLDKVGQANTADAQRQIDLDYQNYLEKQGYTRDQINFMTSQLAGQPAPTNSSTVGTTPAPNGLAQVVGAGLSGLSLYNAYK